MRRLLLAAISVAIFCAPTLALADGQNWAIGKWEGDVVGIPEKSKLTPHRILIIKSVAPDGMAKGTYDIGEAKFAPDIRVGADTVEFSFANGKSDVALKKTSDDTLAGTAKVGSRSFDLTLKRAH